MSLLWYLKTLPPPSVVRPPAAVTLLFGCEPRAWPGRSDLHPASPLLLSVRLPLFGCPQDHSNILWLSFLSAVNGLPQSILDPTQAFVTVESDAIWFLNIFPWIVYYLFAPYYTQFPMLNLDPKQQMISVVQKICKMFKERTVRREHHVIPSPSFLAPSCLVSFLLVRGPSPFPPRWFASKSEFFFNKKLGWANTWSFLVPLWRTRQEVLGSKPSRSAPLIFNTRMPRKWLTYMCFVGKNKFLSSNDFCFSFVLSTSSRKLQSAKK